MLIEFINNLNNKVLSLFSGQTSILLNAENTETTQPPIIPGTDEIISAILPNAWVILAHVLATIILLTMIIWLVWKPTKKYLEKRKNQILADVNEANSKKEISNKNLEISKKELLESKEAAAKIIQNATIEGEAIKNKMEKAALKRVNYLESEAEHNIKKQEDKANLKMNQKASLMAIEIAESLLNKKLDSDENKKMVDSIIKELSKEDKN